MKLNEFLEIAQKPHDGLNVDLLRAVAARLQGLKHEKHYDQKRWAKKTACGTACCIAGWTLLEAGATQTQLLKIEDGIELENEGYTHVGDLAANLLGLTDSQYERLFDEDAHGWPMEFAERFHNAVLKRSKERPSRIAAEFLTAIADGTVKL